MIFVRDITEARKEMENILELTRKNDAMDLLLQGTMRLVNRFAMCNLEDDTYKFYSLHGKKPPYDAYGTYHDLIRRIASRYKVVAKDETIDKVISADHIRGMIRSMDDIYKLEYCTEDEKHFKSMAFIPLSWKDGVLEKVLLISQDTTQEKLAEIESRIALKEAYEAANKANRSKTEFLSNMSHDIRTPMNAIIGYAELMERHWGDNELTTNYLHKLKGASQFLLALIGNVLEIARIESGKETLNEAPWNLKKINDTLEIVLDREILNKQLHVARNIEIQHADVYCDSLKIQEIIMNLVSNAIKYTPDGGKIDVDIEEMEAVGEDSIILRICVSDTGIGISQKYIPHIFEAFTREKNSSESGIMGTGLGLRIVKSFVDLMDGSVIVQSEPGKGSSFIVEIPCRIVSEEERIDQAEQSMPENFLKCKRILLVEDNELNMEIARTILQDVQAEVEVAADGAIAVAMLQKAPVGYYDVILMDIQMPKMNGYQATEAIRKLPDERAQVPIIAMTANAFEEDRQAAFAAGMDDYLAKPIEIDKLLRKIVKVLEKK